MNCGPRSPRGGFNKNPDLDGVPDEQRLEIARREAVIAQEVSQYLDGNNLSHIDAASYLFRNGATVQRIAAAGMLQAVLQDASGALTRTNFLALVIASAVRGAQTRLSPAGSFDLSDSPWARGQLSPKSPTRLLGDRVVDTQRRTDMLSPPPQPDSPSSGEGESSSQVAAEDDSTCRAIAAGLADAVVAMSPSERVFVFRRSFVALSRVLQPDAADWSAMLATLVKHMSPETVHREVVPVFVSRFSDPSDPPNERTRATCATLFGAAMLVSESVALRHWKLYRALLVDPFVSVRVAAVRQLPTYVAVCDEPMVRETLLEVLHPLVMDECTEVAERVLHILVSLVSTVKDARYRSMVLEPILMGYLVNTPPIELAPAVAHCFGQLLHNCPSLTATPGNLQVIHDFYVTACQSPDPKVRYGAAFNLPAVAAAYSTADRNSTIAQLLQDLAVDKEVEVRVAVAAGFRHLAHIDNPAISDVFVSLLADSNAVVRDRAFAGAPDVMKRVLEKMRNLPPSRVREETERQFLSTVLKLLVKHETDVRPNWRRVASLLAVFGRIARYYTALDVLQTLAPIVIRHVVTGAAVMKYPCAVLAASLISGAATKSSTQVLASVMTNLVAAGHSELSANRVAVLIIAAAFGEVLPNTPVVMTYFGTHIAAAVTDSRVAVRRRSVHAVAVATPTDAPLIVEFRRKLLNDKDALVAADAFALFMTKGLLGSSATALTEADNRPRAFSSHGETLQQLLTELKAGTQMDVPATPPAHHLQSNDSIAADDGTVQSVLSPKGRNTPKTQSVDFTASIHATSSMDEGAMASWSSKTRFIPTRLAQVSPQGSSFSSMVSPHLASLTLIDHRSTMNSDVLLAVFPQVMAGAAAKGVKISQRVPSGPPSHDSRSAH